MRFVDLLTWRQYAKFDARKDLPDDGGPLSSTWRCCRTFRTNSAWYWKASKNNHLAKKTKKWFYDWRLKLASAVTDVKRIDHNWVDVKGLSYSFDVLTLSRYDDRVWTGIKDSYANLSSRPCSIPVMNTNEKWKEDKKLQGREIVFQLEIYFVDCDGSPQCLSLRIEHRLFGGLSSSCQLEIWNNLGDSTKMNT